MIDPETGCELLAPISAKNSDTGHARLHTIADQLAPALEHAEQDKPGYTQFLAELLAAEVHAAQQRRLQGRLRFARLPARKTIEQFDFSAQPSLDRRLVEDLATLRFIEERANVSGLRLSFAIEIGPFFNLVLGGLRGPRTRRT